MPVAAIVDEGRLERRFDPHNLGEVNIAAKLFFTRGFEIEFLNSVTTKDDHPGFFGVGRIDKHFVGHVKLVWARRVEGQRRQPRSANRTLRLGVASTKQHRALDGRVSETKKVRGGNKRHRSANREETTPDAPRG